MARKTIDVHIQEEGRDKGKVFRITEMPASQGEKWAMRLLLAAASSGMDIPQEVWSAGMAGFSMLFKLPEDVEALPDVARSSIMILMMRILSGVPFQEAIALTDEMFGCVQIIPDVANNPARAARPLIEDDIEEIATRVKLR